MSNLGDVHYFQSISATRTADSLFLSQRKYTLEILDRTSMLKWKPTSTLADLFTNFDGLGLPTQDPTLY